MIDANAYHALIADLSMARALLDDAFIEGPPGRLYDDQGVNQAHRIIAALCDGLPPMKPRPVTLKVPVDDDECPF